MLKPTMEKKYGESLPSFEVLLNVNSANLLEPIANSMQDLGGRRSPKNHLNSLFKQISPTEREKHNRSMTKSIESKKSH